MSSPEEHASNGASPSQTRIDPSTNPVVDIVGSDLYTCAIKRDGSLYCWGALDSLACSGDEPPPCPVDWSMEGPEKIAISPVRDVIVGNRPIVIATTLAGDVLGWGAMIEPHYRLGEALDPHFDVQLGPGVVKQDSDEGAQTRTTEWPLPLRINIRKGSIALTTDRLCIVDGRRIGCSYFPLNRAPTYLSPSKVSQLHPSFVGTLETLGEAPANIVGVGDDLLHGLYIVLENGDLYVGQDYRPRVFPPLQFMLIGDTFSWIGLSKSGDIAAWPDRDASALIHTPRLPVKTITSDITTVAVLYENGEVDGGWIDSVDHKINLFPFPLGFRATDVVVGPQRMCVLDDAGRVWCVGNNMHGACGVKSDSPATESFSKPVLVPIPQ